MPSSMLSKRGRLLSTGKFEQDLLAFPMRRFITSGWELLRPAAANKMFNFKGRHQLATGLHSFIKTQVAFILCNII